MKVELDTRMNEWDDWDCDFEDDNEEDEDDDVNIYQRRINYDFRRFNRTFGKKRS